MATTTRKAAAKKSAARRRAAQVKEPDALDALIRDHKRVEELFERYEQTGPNATKAKLDLVEQILTELSIHAGVEEQVLYPSVRLCSEEFDDDVLESLEEHHVVKLLLAELQRMHPDDERYDAKVKVLMESVRHHVEEEEQELFPAVRAAMDDELLAELGESIEKARAAAPTRPHPHAPDQPPGIVLASAVSGVVDRVMDFGRSVGRDAGAAISRARRG